MIYLFVAIANLILQTAMPNQQKPNIPPPQVQSPDICQYLKKPEHIKLAKLLTGNEKKLFCAIFDDEMRDETVALTTSKPPKSAKDAVISVAKKNDLLYSSKPGDACGPK